MAKRIVIATGNQGKVREMINAFKNLDVELISLKELPEKYPEPVEDGDSFQANSLLKAKYYCEVAKQQFKNATDEENNAKLQSELQDLALAGSPAAYKCALTFVDTDGHKLFAEGSCSGEIHLEARGQNGFGYDPYFYVGAKTMAEITLEEKQAISHRGEAIAKMAELLKKYLAN